MDSKFLKRWQINYFNFAEKNLSRFYCGKKFEKCQNNFNAKIINDNYFRNLSGKELINKYIYIHIHRYVSKILQFYV